MSEKEKKKKKKPMKHETFHAKLVNIITNCMHNLSHLAGTFYSGPEKTLCKSQCPHSVRTCQAKQTSTPLFTDTVSA